MQQTTRRNVVPTAPEEIPDDARVWDYDELDEQAKHALVRAVAGDDPGGIAGVESGDVVVYTDYYLVR